jgi:hypothetical protein
MTDSFIYDMGRHGRRPRRHGVLGARKSLDNPRHFVQLLGTQPFDLSDQFLNRRHTFTLRQTPPKIHLGKTVRGRNLHRSLKLGNRLVGRSFWGLDLER